MLRIRLNVVLFIFIFFAISVPLASSDVNAAEEEGAIPGEAGEKGEYDFSWLDPDKKIYVVQNRKYTKAKRLELVASAGFGFGEPYRSSTVFVPRAVYYFNESWGLSVLGLMASNSENDNIRVLKQESASALPYVRDVRGFWGGSVVWVPFYAKINTFNRIFYIDWHWEAGLAGVSSEIDTNTVAANAPEISTSNHMGFFWGTGQKFFVSRNFAVRLDLLGLYYSAPRASRGVLLTETEMNSQYYFTLGASYTF